MKSRYVLVHSPQGLVDAAAQIAADHRRVMRFLPARRITKQVVEGLPTALTNKLDNLLSSIGTTFGVELKLPRPTISQPDAPPRIVVGVWSLDAWLGKLSDLIEKLNRIQAAFTFYEVQAAVPAGLISRPERLVLWLEALGKEPPERAKRDIEDNLIAGDFFGLAEGIRKDFKLDYLVGITPSMVAGSETNEIYWNHFSTFEDRIVLASSYQLHEFAQSTGLPFEAFLTTVIISQVLVATSYPDLGFHDDRGCLFDYDASRVSLIDKVRKPSIDAECLAALKPLYREAAQSVADFIRSLRSVEP
jgi:hypothetical protein